jgi:hypothetical protein
MNKSKAQERLKEWFMANGGSLNPSLSLTYTRSSGQHFRATTSITASESSPAQLCNCPFSLSLSFLNILASPPASIRNCSSESICTHLIDRIPKATQNYFFLCEQRLLGEKSFWAPYIDVLPNENELTTPWWFNEEDLVWLLGTGVHVSPDPEKSGVEMRRAMWQEQWKEGVKVLWDAGVGAEEYTW